MGAALEPLGNLSEPLGNLSEPLGGLSVNIHRAGGREKTGRKEGENRAAVNIHRVTRPGRKCHNSANRPRKIKAFAPLNVTTRRAACHGSVNIHRRAWCFRLRVQGGFGVSSVGAKWERAAE
jgi:hypothetical protein